MSVPNAKPLQQGLTYLAQIISWRIKTYFKKTDDADPPVPRPPQDWLAIASPFTEFVHEHELNLPE